MSRGSKIGVVLGVLVLIARFALDGVLPENPVDAALRRNGNYVFVMTGVVAAVLATLAWLWVEERRVRRLRANLRRLRASFADLTRRRPTTQRPRAER